MIRKAVKGGVRDFLTGEGTAAQGTRIQQHDFSLNPGEALSRGYATMDQLRTRLEVFAHQEGESITAAAGDFANLTIRARRFTEVLKDGAEARAGSQAQLP